MTKRKFEQYLFDIDYNKSSKACDPCVLECEKINRKVNNRKLTEIKNAEAAHIFLNIFEKKR